ncbi:MAG: thiol-disulfide oxidoreductase DCC family protein [Chitinophagaceae bacterium]|nr:thiol-disulfide oxidoreductase DCC family protein [Chitinophagaceae bacterium]
MNQDGPVIIFDGVCNLCNKSVQFVLKRDRKKQFRFATLQGKAADTILQNAGLAADELNSFILFDKGKIYTRSTGALRLCRKLSGAWPLLYGFMIVPRFIRDAVYKWIARNRYKWFGKKETCMIPDASIKSRFLD